MGPRAGLDRRKISPLPGFDPRTVQPVVSFNLLWGYRKMSEMLYFNMVKVENSWSVTLSDPIRFQDAAIMLRGQVAFESPCHYGY